MNRETINTKTEEEWLELRTRDITSTEISALFNINPYLSEFELYHRKKEGNIIKLDNEPMRWGRRLETPVALGLAEDFNINNIRLMKEYMRLPEHRLGSSFDYAIGDDGIFEIKTVGIRSFQNWEIVENEILECPVFIEMQVQHELLVSGREYAIIGVLVGGQQGFIVRREKDENVHNAIINQAEKFWRSVDAGEEPTPDFEKDAKFISSLFDFAEPGKVIDARTDERLDQMVKAYGEIAEHVKMWTGKKDAMKAKLLMSIQDAEKVKGENWTISAGLVGPCHMEYDRQGYRNFRVNFKKIK